LTYLLIQEPAIIEHCCGHPAGSMAGSTNCINAGALSIQAKYWLHYPRARARARVQASQSTDIK